MLLILIRIFDGNITDRQTRQSRRHIAIVNNNIKGRLIHITNIEDQHLIKYIASRINDSHSQGDSGRRLEVDT